MHVKHEKKRGSSTPTDCMYGSWYLPQKEVFWEYISAKFAHLQAINQFFVVKATSKKTLT